jgi:hypothetical protein
MRQSPIAPQTDPVLTSNNPSSKAAPEAAFFVCVTMIDIDDTSFGLVAEECRLTQWPDQITAEARHPHRLRVTPGRRTAMPNPTYAALRDRRRALQRLTDEMLAAHLHAAMQASGGKFNAAVDILMSRVAA